MLINQKNIADKLMDDLEFFNHGFHGLYIDHTAARLVTTDGKTNLAYGIDDRFGNYFYLRNDGVVNIGNAAKIMDCDKSLELRSNIVFVANVKNADPEQLLQCILNSLGTHHDNGAQLQITSALITNERVVATEYPFMKADEHKQILARISGWSLVKVVFSGFSFFQPNSRDCWDCKPCKDC